MWKRTKNTGQTRPCFSIVHQYIQRFNEVSGNKPAAVKKRSKTPGVMITQYVVNLPEGKITPDFQCIPVPVTINEGKTAIFKAVVTGDPKPDVSWRRTKGTLSDKEKFQRKYEDSTGEYILEIHKVTHEETDTYKCYAVNEYGKAVCTTTLNVIDASTNPTDFRKLLKKSKAEKADGENDVRFWDAMLNADRRDYESICSQYGVADLQLVLKKLEERKKERKQNLLKCGDESVNVNRQNLIMCQLEVDESSGNKKVKESVRSEKEKKKVQWNDHDSESGDKHVDVDQNHISNMSQHKNYGSSGNEMLETMVTNENKTEVFQESVAGLNEQAGDNEEDEPSGKRKHRGNSKQCLKSKDEDGSVIPGDHCEYDQTEDVSDSTNTRHKRQSPLTEDSLSGVQFIWGLSDVGAIVNETAELTCKLSCEDCPGVWFRDGKKISPDDNFNIIKDGPIHKLVIRKCDELHSGKYRFEADGRKTEAMINVKDPPRFDHEHLHVFTEPMTVKVGQSAVFKLQFVGRPPIKIQWHREGEELQDESNTKIEKSAGHSRLLLSRCQRKDTGEIRIKLKNEHGFAEAVSHLIVLDKPSSPLGPAEVTESSANSIEFKWRAPKDDGGSPVSQYILERQQVGRNTWKKIGETPGAPSYRDTDVERGRKYCYRIQAVTSEGTSDVMETDEMQAGKFALPGPPLPPKVVSAFSDCITLSWAPPSNTGGSRILGYVLEKRKRGSNLWTVVNTVDPIKERTYSVRDVVEGIEYEFRVSAINLSGTGEFSNASEFEFARDPKKPPGKVTGLKVTETSYTNIILTWIKPEEKPGFQDEAKGYFVEIRQTDCIEWYRCNSTSIVTTSFNVRGLKSMDMYWVRVIATNDGGESPPEELPKYVVAMPSAVRPKFTKNKMKSFMVVRAGNSVRITVNFEASPQPEIMWLKDNVPVFKRVTISNSDGSTQLLIPCSEHSDSGIYSVLVKNVAGQETFNTDVRVTDDPKPPGAVALEENVPGTVTVIWEPSPDEKRDDRLHYTVSKLDSTKHTWTMVADRLFNNRFTICNLMHGREYHFRVYAKNDIGISEPSLSPTWGIEKKKEKLVSREPTSKHCDLQCAPSFMVPLKLHTAPKGYECHMSCAVKGNPTPRITWYRNHISINTDANYYIYNTVGVCSMRILCVGPKDSGEYTVVAENSLGRAECSTVLRVRE
ncbi:unnamed protein product [Menidia menidia]|uniref:(Atlantic silverside) hypothetical protein n=1 Tax=Menidia menidia TaxID=238744 RepID=A0A8S4BTU0_9TELE|nr:unnamed protein product [Menidia menidia]